MTSSGINEQNRDSASEVKEFYDRYFVKKLTYPANEIDAVFGFFRKRGFEEEAARSVSAVLLQQAKLDDIKVFKLLDTLTGLNQVQLNSLVAEILNYNRPKSSTLGYRVQDETQWNESRNIIV